MSERRPSIGSAGAGPGATRQARGVRRSDRGQRDRASEQRGARSAAGRDPSAEPEPRRDRTAGPEQRRDPRVALQVPVRISTIDPERDPGTGRPFFRATDETCANVSRTGLFVRTHEPLEPGRRLLVELHIPDGPDVDAVGRVAWVKRSLIPASERGVGVELLGAGRAQLASLHAWVAERTRREDCKRRAGRAEEHSSSESPPVG